MNPAMRRVLKNTVGIYRSAVKHIGRVIMEYWDEITRLEKSNDRQNFIDNLIHAMKDNVPADMDFDRLFYKMPSYYRRAAVRFAYGQVSSFVTRYEEYEQERIYAISHGRKFRKRPPKLNLETNVCPTLYKGNMFLREGRVIKIKVYIRNTWDFAQFILPVRDHKDLVRTISKGSLKNPSLVFAYDKFYLHFPVIYKGTSFPDTSLYAQKIMAVDLGLNHGAVCCATDLYGTVHERAFDPFKDDMDRINKQLDLIREKNRASGKNQSLSKCYTKLSGLKDNYTAQLARWIVDKARSWGVYAIVLENLGRMKGRGRHKDRIHHWCKRRIMKLIKGMTSREGIRVFIINPRNTSALAFDGSGKVKHSAGNFSLCTFKSGKQYNCDLNAAYNIAARYFIRQLARELPDDVWKSLSAEVPEAERRTECTLSTLWKISRANTLAQKA